MFEYIKKLEREADALEEELDNCGSAWSETTINRRLDYIESIRKEISQLRNTFINSQ